MIILICSRYFTGGQRLQNQHIDRSILRKLSLRELLSPEVLNQGQNLLQYQGLCLPSTCEITAKPKKKKKK